MKWYVFVFLCVFAGFGSLLFLMGLEMECSQAEHFVVEVGVGVDSGRYHGFLYRSLRRSIRGVWQWWVVVLQTLPGVFLCERLFVSVWLLLFLM